MRYGQGGGLTAEGRKRREQVRLEAVKRFEQRAPSAVVAAELRVSERSVRRWRSAWLAEGTAGLASRGQAARCRLDEQQLAALDAVLDAGPLAAGYQDQRWTLARIRDLAARKFKVRAELRAFTAAQPWLRVFQLPSYAPDLNPVEGIWSVLKRGVLANLAVASFTHLIQVIRHGLKKIQYQPLLIEGCLIGTGLSMEPDSTDITN